MDRTAHNTIEQELANASQPSRRHASPTLSSISPQRAIDECDACSQRAMDRLSAEDQSQEAAQMGSRQVVARGSKPKFGLSKLRRLRNSSITSTRSKAPR